MGKTVLLQLGSRGLPNPESEKQKGCNLLWIISETTVKRLKEIIPFYHMFIACLCLDLQGWRLHFLSWSLDLGIFLSSFCTRSCFSSKSSHRLHCRIRTLVTPEEETPNKHTKQGERKNTSPKRAVQQQRHRQACKTWQSLQQRN